MSEVSRKIDFMRSLLQENSLAAIHLRGVDWFSWATCGGSSVVIMTAEIGIAEVFITLDGAWILTNRIESQRLLDEEAPNEYQVTSFAWQNSLAITNFIDDKVRGKKVASDRPVGDEVALPIDLRIFKMKMQPEEIERYRKVGEKAAISMTDALAMATPDWTENQLAGAGAQALWSRGLEPTLILVAGENRGQKYRHPISKDNLLGESAMMVFCARGFGLYANLTRFIYFREPRSTEKKSFAVLEEIESVAFHKTREGNLLGDVYDGLRCAYEKNDLPNEIHLHHQGGPTGYLSREIVAGPKLSEHSSLESSLKIETGMAFAWNPSLPGAKIEDTVLLGNVGLEVLTRDSRWPSKKVAGLDRPQIWIRK